MKMNIDDYTEIFNTIDTAEKNLLSIGNLDDLRIDRAIESLDGALMYMRSSCREHDAVSGNVRRYLQYAIDDLDNYLREFDTDRNVDGIASDLTYARGIIDKPEEATP